MKSDGATDVARILATSCASQAVPSNLSDGQFKDYIALIERVSHNGGLDWVDARGVFIPLNVVTNMRVTVGDVQRDYLSYRTPLFQYVDTPCKIVALGDICQRVAGLVRSQDLIREQRGPRGWG